MLGIYSLEITVIQRRAHVMGLTLVYGQLWDVLAPAVNGHTRLFFFRFKFNEMCGGDIAEVLSLCDEDGVSMMTRKDSGMESHPEQLGQTAAKLIQEQHGRCWNEGWNALRRTSAFPINTHDQWLSIGATSSTSNCFVNVTFNKIQILKTKVTYNLWWSVTK